MCWCQRGAEAAVIEMRRRTRRRTRRRKRRFWIASHLGRVAAGGVGRAVGGGGCGGGCGGELRHSIGVSPSLVRHWQRRDGRWREMERPATTTEPVATANKRTRAPNHQRRSLLFQHLAHRGPHTRMGRALTHSERHTLTHSHTEVCNQIGDDQ